MGITITEALAEIKTIQKRIESKKHFIIGFLCRPDGLKDPFEKNGGSFQAIARERQAIADLEARVVEIRRGIQTANEMATLVIEGEAKTIASWLVWRREVAPGQKEFLNKLRNDLSLIRQRVRAEGKNVVTGTETFRGCLHIGNFSGRRQLLGS